jgi:hypothetical protein
MYFVIFLCLLLSYIQKEKFTGTVVCDALRAELFPPPAELDAEAPDLSKPLLDELPNPWVKMSEVKRAIFSQHPNKSPGPDGIPFLALCWAWNCVKGEFYLMIAKCVAVGYHPRVWTESISVAIRKPNHTTGLLQYTYM